jgi:hypothetical protein
MRRLRTARFGRADVLLHAGKSATATTIEHRWYQGNRMRRVVQLRVEASPGTGYRTYSRNTISSERAGDWRVELRSADGTVLHEERFTVR